jgi:NAD(P)-dependent dehydrogenase (short-subunit alcohol dehydrogenase family)
VTSYEDMQRAANAAKDTYGRLDVWINNAGVMPPAVETLIQRNP